MTVHVAGRVCELETGRPVKGITVEAYDSDVFLDSLLGRAKTDADGRYVMATKSPFGFLLGPPDVYVVLKDDEGHPLKSTRAPHSHDLRSDLEIDVSISCLKLMEAGLLASEDLPAELHAPVDPTFAHWSFTLPGDDPIASEIDRDLTAQGSILALFASYRRSLRTSPDNQAPAFAKMAKLFALGSTPERLEGHFYGVLLGLHLSARKHALSHLDNVIGLVWGATLEEQSPWVGKSFRPLDEPRWSRLTGQPWDPGRPAFLGINHFNRVEWHAANRIAYHALSFWFDLHEASATEKATYAYQRKGGNFIAARGPSVSAETQREVFGLNYRWPRLHNNPPLSWLMDELVEVAQGLYLGQLLFATRGLLSSFDPRRPVDDYAYNHMGYFLLWTDRWNGEARRLFSFLEIPLT